MARDCKRLVSLWIVIQATLSTMNKIGTFSAYLTTCLIFSVIPVGRLVRLERRRKIKKFEMSYILEYLRG